MTCPTPPKAPSRVDEPEAFPNPPEADPYLPPVSPPPPAVGPVTTSQGTLTEHGASKAANNLGPVKTSQGTLTEHETAFILKTTLIPEHADDPNVLRFISNYMRCRDSRQAAKEAGINPGSGPVLRARPDIHLAIEKLTQKSVMKYGYDASEVIEKVKEVAGIDPVEFENADGSFKTHFSQMRPEARRAVKKFKAKNLYEKDPNGMTVLVGQLIEVELHDKMKAIELLGREKHIFTETKRVEHDVTSNMANILLESKKRADESFNELMDVTPVPQLTGKTDE